MLPQIQALPNTKHEPTHADGDRLGRLGNGRTRVCGHVVRALVVVFPVARLGREIRQELRQVTEHRGICIFLDHEAGRRVLNEDGAQAGAHGATREHGVHFSRHVRQTATRGTDFEGFLVVGHGLWYAMLSRLMPESMSDGWMKSSEAPPPSGRWDRVSIRAAELCATQPWSHRAWLVARGLITRDTLQAASAMAFDLFLAAIPMLALAGWLFARLSQGSDAVLTSASLLVDLTPSEVRSLVWLQLGQFSVSAVAPVALLGALWLASSAFNTLMAVLEVTVGAERREWWKRRRGGGNPQQWPRCWGGCARDSAPQVWEQQQQRRQHGGGCGSVRSGLQQHGEQRLRRRRRGA